jgi:hypothetical protein
MDEGKTREHMGRTPATHPAAAAGSSMEDSELENASNRRQYHICRMGDQYGGRM